jgi:hypothetical protein
MIEQAIRVRFVSGYRFSDAVEAVDQSGFNRWGCSAKAALER